VAGVDLPVDDDMKVLGIVIDRRLTFHKHVWTVHCLSVQQRIDYEVSVLSSDAQGP